MTGVLQSIWRLILHVRDLGVAGQPPATVRRLRTINLITLITAVITLFYDLFYALYDTPFLYREAVFIAVIIVLLCTVFLATRAGRAELAMWMLIAIAMVQLAGINWMLGPKAGALAYLIAAPFLLTLVSRPGDRFAIWPTGILAVTIYMVVSLTGGDRRLEATPRIVQDAYLFSAVFGAILLASGISQFFRWLLERAEAELQAEKARGDRLLRAILPAPIAELLKGDGQNVIADRFPAATVVFADIVGFTARFAAIDPSRMVGDLNRVFSRIDEIADWHGVEKIKTIGDAYFAVCGVPDPKPDHAARVANFALDLIAATAELGKDAWPGLQLRIVIHTGPIVAGVIGRTKFAYDIWGDTVNTAARMKDICEPNEIVLSDATRQALPATYALEAKGAVMLRDKGSMPAFRLVGKRPDQR